MNANHQTPLRLLRECQSRSAREQQILSGRDWLFVTALVQFLTALYPAYRCSSDIFLMNKEDALYGKDIHVAIGMLSVSAILLILWGWAKYAPFRAASVALAFYVLLQTYVAMTYPTHVLDGIASKILVLLGLIMAVRAGYRRRHSS